MAQKSTKPKTPGGGTTVQAGSSLYLVYGDDDYLVGRKAKEWVQALCPESDQALGLEIIDGRVDVVAEAVASVRACLGALQTVGFFGGRKVVWFRDVNFLNDSVVGRSREVKDEIEHLTQLIKKGLQADQILVVSAAKVDGRTAFFKACQAAGQVVQYATPERTEQADERARDYALEAFRARGLRPVSGDVVERFIEKTGPDTRQIEQEAEKLYLYLGDRKDIRDDDVQAIVSSSRESVAWDLADAVGRRELRRALLVLRQLLFQKESEVGLVIGLEGRFRDLLLLDDCRRRGWVRIEEQGRYQKAVWTGGADGERALGSMKKDPRKTHPYRTLLLLQQAARYSPRELLAGQAEIVRSHEMMVSSGVPGSILLELLVLKLVGDGKAPARRMAG